MSAIEIASRIEQLPAEARQEVVNFVEFLEQKSTILQKKGKLSFSWAGGLRELREQYTSVELQHQASEWRLES